MAFEKLFAFLFGCSICFVSLQVSAACDVDVAANRYSIDERSELFAEAYGMITFLHGNSLVTRKSNQPVEAVFDVWFKTQSTKTFFLAEARAAGFVVENDSPVDLDGYKYYLLLVRKVEKDLICLAKSQALLWSIAIGKEAKVDMVQLVI